MAERKRRGDRGYSTLEVTVVLPVVLLMVMALVQAALYLLASDLAQTAANKGSLAGASWQSSPDVGVERASTWAGTQRLLRGTSVSSEGSNADSVRITVTGEALTLVPGWTLTIRETAEQPVEALP
ncbi:TadE/TadG family type IV pilus assembly protein [Streptomyces xiamenensis]|uniref:TadE/TadG family type IV pilus assembly protein n=1 Tax=Streptomyces xiamenensis TaxID=408015 RepID=UPI0035DC38D8